MMSHGQASQASEATAIIESAPLIICSKTDRAAPVTLWLSTAGSAAGGRWCASGGCGRRLLRGTGTSKRRLLRLEASSCSSGCCAACQRHGLDQWIRVRVSVSYAQHASKQQLKCMHTVSTTASSDEQGSGTEHGTLAKIWNSCGELAWTWLTLPSGWERIRAAVSASGDM